MRQINKKYRNSTVVANKLATENMNIVYKVLYDKFKGNAYDLLLSVAYDELYNAAYRYDTNSNLKFTTYAYNCIYFKLLEALNKEKTYKDNVSLCGDFGSDDVMTEDIKAVMLKNFNRGGIDTDYDELQTLADLGLYEMGWEMRHQELKGGRDAKPRDFKQRKIIKRVDENEND